MKRILYICSESSPGMVPFAASIINNTMKSEKLEVYALVVSKNINYRDYIRQNEKTDNIEFINASQNLIINIISKFINYKLLYKIIVSVRKCKIDYIHLLTSDYTLSMFVPLLRKTAKVVFTVHDMIPHESSTKSLKEKFFKKYITWGCRQNTLYADILVTCSQQQFMSLKEKYPQKKQYFHNFPSLVTDGIINGNERCPELEKFNGKYILFFGHVDVYKGVELLYNTFLNSPVLYSSYSLVIAGRGDWYFNRRKNETNIIRINRFIKDSEVKILFQNASCTVYPYLSATMSGILSLAYKFQSPLIVSDIPYFKENAENEQTALFFKKDDENDLAIKLKKLLFDTDLGNMKSNQKKYYDMQYSNDSTLLKEIINIYAD